MFRDYLCGSLDTALNRLLQVTSVFKNNLYSSLSSPRFHNSQLTQSEAKKFCENEQQIPARLIEIDSSEENSAINAEIKRRNSASQKVEFWLGITDRHLEGHWVLESTTKPIVFTNWSSGEPNNSGNPGHENCAHISTWNYKWNDRKCSHKTGNGWIRTALCEM